MEAFAEVGHLLSCTDRVPTLICCGLLSACVAIINEHNDKVSHVSFVPLSFVLTCTLTDTDFIFVFFTFVAGLGTVEV